MIPSATQRSFKVYALNEDNSRVFIGLISRKELSRLLHGEISFADICKYAENPAAEKVAQETLNSLKIAIADPSKLGAPSQ